MRKMEVVFEKFGNNLLRAEAVHCLQSGPLVRTLGEDCLAARCLTLNSYLLFLESLKTPLPLMFESGHHVEAHQNLQAVLFTEYTAITRIL